AGGAVSVDEDNYDRLDGQTFRWRSDTAADVTRRKALDAGASDGYEFEGLLGADAVFDATMLRFDKSSTASARIQTVRDDLAAGLGTDEPVAALTVAPTFGDESTYLKIGNGDSDVSGYGVALRVGAEVSLVVIVSTDGVPQQAATALASAQVTCLTANG